MASDRIKRYCRNEKLDLCRNSRIASLGIVFLTVLVLQLSLDGEGKAITWDPNRNTRSVEAGALVSPFASGAGSLVEYITDAPARGCSPSV